MKKKNKRHNIYNNRFKIDENYKKRNVFYKNVYLLQNFAIIIKKELRKMETGYHLHSMDIHSKKRYSFFTMIIDINIHIRFFFRFDLS